MPKQKKETKNIYQQIVEHCIECMRLYDPVKYSVDTWSEEYLKKITDKNIQLFVKQVFYGCQRYSEFLASFNEVLFEKFSSQTNRQDGKFYQIMVYLLVFRFDDLKEMEMKQMLLSQDAIKLNVMIQFLFDTLQLEQNLKEKWQKVYDPEFIETQVLKQLDSRLDTMWFLDLLQNINEKATGRKDSGLVVEDDESNKSVQSKKITQFQEFNLTKPKAKKLPEPIKIEVKVKSKQVPSTNQAGKYEEMKQQKQQKYEQEIEKTVNRYKNDKKQKFNLETELRPSNMEKLKKEVNYKEEEKLKFNKVHRIDMPEYRENGSVRMTYGQILREEKKIKEKQKEEEEVLKNLEINMRDSSEFNNWKREQDHLEELQRLEDQHRRKVEMELAREKAAQAFREQQDLNKQIVKEVQLEAEKGLLKRDQLLQQEFEDNIRKVEEQNKQFIRAQNEKQRVIDVNKEIHDQQMEQMRLLQEKRRQEEKVENEKRDLLIQQIKEFERQPKERVKGFDPTECQGWGLLEEMSIAELRERLERNKREREEEMRLKMQEKKVIRDEKIQLLEDKMDLIHQERQKREWENQQERNRKRNEQMMREQREKEIKERSILQVQSKIDTKKINKQKEEERIEKELKEIRLKRQYMNANKAKVEAQAWKNLQDGKLRDVQFRQNNKLLSKEKEMTRKWDQTKIIYKQKKLEANTEQNIQNQYDMDYTLAEKENDKFIQQDREEKQFRNDTIRHYKEKHTESMIQRHPYKQKINQESIMRSKNRSQQEGIKLPPPQYADL